MFLLSYCCYCHYCTCYKIIAITVTVTIAMTLPCLMLVTLGPGAMISDLSHLCYHHYIYVLDPILQVIVTYYVL